ncbi:hypothetical protein K440DRAFT_663164 [Wilcoxina mikolae CBS 423.85]|nr:hypothetical protein K440DRAFT_663164 [Wilcoxina mikolae CBS 423.85]
MRFQFFVATLLFAAFVSAQSSPEVDDAAQRIWDNNDEPWCREVFLHPVTRTRTLTTTVTNRIATRARSTRTVRVFSTTTTDRTVRSTATQTVFTTTTTTTTIDPLARRSTLARRQSSRPGYLDGFSDNVVAEACLLLVDPRIVVVTAPTRATRTLAARTTTVGTATTTVSAQATITQTTTSVTSTTTTVTIVRTVSANPGDPNGPPPPDDPGTTRSTVTTGSPLCRDFTGSGAIATSVFSYSFSRSVDKESYIVDWDIQNQIDCCNKCASVPLGCSFWRYQDSCLMVVNPRQVDNCPAQTALITVTTSGRADRESMAGPGPCDWPIRRVQG